MISSKRVGTECTYSNLNGFVRKFCKDDDDMAKRITATNSRETQSYIRKNLNLNGFVRKFCKGDDMWKKKKSYN